MDRCSGSILGSITVTDSFPNSITYVKKATILDYVELQGGRPDISQDEGGLWHIKHLYRKDAPEIVTHISPTERGQVVINGVEYDVSSLWQFEGQPCETRSASEGGYGYERTKNV